MIEAAGGVLWRPSLHGLEVAVAHRPKYDDWSLPKGKLERGEYPLLAAIREVEEETGFVGRTGRMLGEIHYLKDATPKRVRYWAMQVAGGAFAVSDEVDELAWLPLPDALARLDPGHDRSIGEAFAVDVRPTTPCVLVPHDDRRPRQELILAAVLATFDITVEPENLLSDNGFLADSDAEVSRVLASAAAAEPTLLCGQGEAIRALLPRVCAELGGAACEKPIATGGFAVLHIAADGTRELVAVDSYPSPV